MEETLILGVIVGKGQVKMEKEKIKAVKEWKIPMKVKDVESFLGFANFYQRFIQDFSYTARLLNDLKRKKERTWNKEHDKAFCHMQVHLSGKLHPRGDATSEPYKPAFHGSHLSRNTSHGGAATLRVFCLPRRRYSYSTQSSMMELLLSVSQH